MRFEINIPDSTRPELQAMLASLTKRLSEQPELVQEIQLDENEVIQRQFTPERLSHINQALADVKAGRFFTSDQVVAHFEKKEAAWVRTRNH